MRNEGRGLGQWSARSRENDSEKSGPRSVECEADNWNVKIKFCESGSELQTNENECFGESELKGRKHDTK